MSMCVLVSAKIASLCFLYVQCDNNKGVEFGHGDSLVLWRSDLNPAVAFYVFLCKNMMQLKETKRGRELMS